MTSVSCKSKVLLRFFFPLLVKGIKQARNQLGTPGGAKSFPRGAQIFWTTSNIFKLCPTHFTRGGEKFFWGRSRPYAHPFRDYCRLLGCAAYWWHWVRSSVMNKESDLRLNVNIYMIWTDQEQTKNEKWTLMMKSRGCNRTVTRVILLKTLLKLDMS